MEFAPTDNGVRGTAPRTPDMPRPQTLHQFLRSPGEVQEPPRLDKKHPFTIRAGDLIWYPDDSCLCDACRVVAAAVDPASWPRDRVFDLRNPDVRQRPTGLAAPFADASQSGFQW